MDQFDDDFEMMDDFDEVDYNNDVHPEESLYTNQLKQ